MAQVCAPLTSVAGARPEARAGAIADEAVPALLAHAAVLAGIALALLARLLVARGLDAGAVLRLSDLSDVLAAAVDEEVTHAADVAIVEHGGPQLGGQDEVGTVGGQTPQVHVPLQVQNLTLPAGREREALAVH